MTLLEEYKKKLDKVFDFSYCVRRGFSLDKAEHILFEFKTVCPDHERWQGELALHYAELATDLAVTIVDMDDEFYDSLISAYEEATVAASDDQALFNAWKNRLKSIINNLIDTCEDVAFSLEDSYINIPWVNGEYE